MIKYELMKRKIPLRDFRGQGYNNGSNMAGKLKGALAIIAGCYPPSKFVNCSAHSLNLCGMDAAECCSDVITLFGMAQKLYSLFYILLNDGNIKKNILDVHFIAFLKLEGLHMWKV